jgi:hypothetical protein
MLGLLQPFFFTKRVHIQLQHFKAFFFCHLFGAQENLASALGDRIVRFECSVTGRCL